MLRNRNLSGTSGFTLIELLIVIAIIGVLSSIIFASLNSSRDRGNDAKTKAQLSGVRAAAELYYDTNGSYGPTTNTCNNLFSDQLVNPYITNLPTGVTPNCRVTSSSPVGYSVFANLLSVSGAYWCVDYTGMSKQISAALANGDVTCN